MIGRVLDGRFTIEAKLGAGSMGTVYRAKQHAMGRNVAIKILRSDRALDESSRARFLREARANSLLASAHTVTVFDFGQADNGDFFLAMELLEGSSARSGSVPRRPSTWPVRLFARWPKRTPRGSSIAT
jgi:serine/threonine-protein kinase